LDLQQEAKNTRRKIYQHAFFSEKLDSKTEMIIYFY